MKGVAESMIMTFLMSVGELAPCWDALQYSNHEIIGKIHWGLFVMIVFLLLLNLLIAMMGDTYAKVDNIPHFFISLFLVQIAAIKNEWMRQWAKTLLITERGIAPKWVHDQIFRLENVIFCCFFYIYVIFLKISTGLFSVLFGSKLIGYLILYKRKTHTNYIL